LYQQNQRLLNNQQIAYDLKRQNNSLAFWGLVAGVAGVVVALVNTSLALEHSKSIGQLKELIKENKNK